MIRLRLLLLGDLPSLAGLRGASRHARDLPAPASVKDCVEAAGLPHTEVDLLLADGIPISFDHLVDRDLLVEVHPVPAAREDEEAPGPHPARRLQPRPLRHERFLCDAHLGKLARLLRVLGFDTLYARDADEAALAGIAAAEDRALLSCSRALLCRRQVRIGRLVRSREPDVQAREVVRRFGLTPRVRPFGRCSMCNGELEPAPADEVARRVPPRTRAWRTEYRRCRACGRFYWEGTHASALRRRLDAILEDT
jgi:uncharacterized protein with PIN domain